MHSDKGAMLEEWVLLLTTLHVMKSCNITKLHIFTVLVLLSFFCVGSLRCLRITLYGVVC
jgi:hypothetical protein